MCGCGGLGAGGGACVSVCACAVRALIACMCVVFNLHCFVVAQVPVFGCNMCAVWARALVLHARG